MRERTLEIETRIGRPIDEVFAFFADAFNLDAITPPWLAFKTTTPAPIVMNVGTTIDYRLKIRGVPVRWRSLITAWEPPHRFVDEQVRGPYRRWIHEHTFEATGHQTRMIDRVRYAVWCDPLIHDLLVGPDVRRIFALRGEAIRARFAAASD
jgi:ligand-binding SRPBCC domain-containing protein